MPDLSKPKTLLAKSLGKAPDRERASLREHLRLTYVAAKKICDLTADAQLRTLGLDPAEYGERFRKTLLLAAATHDVGKANSLFQAAVSKTTDAKSDSDWNAQSLRHEWVAYLLLRFTEFGARIKNVLPESTREQDFDALVWAVAGHHRKSKDEIVSDACASGAELLVGPEYDFADCLRVVDDQGDFPAPLFAGLDLAAELAKPQNKFKGKTLAKLLKQSGKNLELQTAALPENEQILAGELENFDDPAPEIAFASAIRTSLIAADVAASAAGDPNDGFDSDVETALNDWFAQTLGRLATPNDLARIVETKIAALPPSDDRSPVAVSRAKFQNAVAESKADVTLCVAGCGSGKTLAAWRWALANCPPNGTRVFFCYPTTGTSTAGFFDYLFDSNEDARFGELLHSRATFDVDYFRAKALEEIRQDRAQDKKKAKSNAKRLEQAKDAADEAAQEAEARMGALEIWGKPIVCCTVDVALRFLVNEYAGILSWPALSQSIFVFDEVHSYDDRLFEWLTRFVGEVASGSKILLLTASLPEARRKKLQKAVEQRPRAKSLAVVEGPADWENVKRYRRFAATLEPDDDPTQFAAELAAKRFRNGEKVLWVRNTVDRAREAVETLRNLGADVAAKTTAYHSRYRYVDRVKRQAECVDAFQGSGPAICVATQVAEMSLDLSADFLITDLAPIPSLIQRFGRLNRRAVADAPRSFYIDEPQNDSGEFTPLPYTLEGDLADWPERTRAWLAKLGTAPLSQTDLTNAWEPAPPANEKSVGATSWLEAGPCPTRNHLRDAGTNIQILLEDDYDAVKRGGRRRFVERVIPITLPPFDRGCLTYWDKYGCFLVKVKKGAFHEGHIVEYDADLGARWPRADSDSSPNGVKGGDKTLFF